MIAQLKPIVRHAASHPSSFYIVVLSIVVVVQLINLSFFLYGGAWFEGILPHYTHVLALTVGTLFLFRAVQLLCALTWARAFGSATPPPAYMIDDKALPIVTVQIPLRNEPLEVARVAIDAAFALDYPADRLEIQVIDNSDGPAFFNPIATYLEDKKTEFGALDRTPQVTFLHRDGTEGFKAGNLNRGRAIAKGSYFLILDADSTVPPSALLTALPYFEDPSLGFVQLRVDPTNEDENVITRAAAVTIRARYLIMRVRDRHGIVQFDGHNGIFRKEALDAVGGWSEEVSEDLATSVRMILAGYRGRFADLPSGELLPTRFQELYKQRGRWALGTAIFLKKDGLAILRSSRLRWFEKLDLFYASLNILVEAFVWIALFTFAPLPATTFVQILIVFTVIPTLMSSGLGFLGSMRRQFTVLFVVSAIFPALAIGALKGAFGIKAQFTVTRKKSDERLRLLDIFRNHGISLIAAMAFFWISWSFAPGLAQYFNSYLPGTIIMSACAVAPFLLNYWTGESPKAASKVHDAV